MLSSEIRERYLKFFEKRRHAVIPSASLVPENDPSSLFITAGMQPLVPYLLGAKHPAGTRLVDVQKCIRTGDIEDVGDNRHLTFFEMLGNWSLGDYFKKEAIEYSMEFLTSKSEGLGLDPKRLYITVFRGENGIPRDEESIKHWEENFAKHNIKAGVAGADEKISGDVRIVPLGTDDNFWIAGNTGPCGPDTEMFYDVVGGKLEGKFHDLVKQGRIIEIWNDVFMEFNKKADGSIEKLAKQNVDTGMGLERTAVVMQQKSTVFETDLFDYLMNAILATPRKALPSNISFETKEEYMRKVRIIADHIRSSVFMIADGVIPSNTEQGYVLRRLIRRAAFNAASIQLQNSLNSFVGIVAEKYKDVYAEIKTKQKHVRNILADEELKFTKTLVEGEKIFNKISTKDISGEDAFKLFSTYGYPLELTVEMANQKGIKVDIAGFQGEFKKHQDISRAGSEQKFKGGLASTGEQETKYHTATHLTLAALQKVLGQAIVQKGSNITAERMRFDFNWPTKLTPEQVKAVEDLVNEKIKEHLPVEMQELPKPEAEKIATTLAFDLSHYGDVVKVYKIGVKDGGYFSIEFCGGPHVKNTGELGHFKIVKEEAVSAGVRRIKAVLE